MFHIVYQITNNINGKTYIGVHSTEDINDSYMGSGTLLHKAYNKYGIENFTKTIIRECSSSQEMLDLEKSLVNEEFVKRSDTYNLKVGGIGGFDMSEDACKSRFSKVSDTMKKRYAAGDRKGWEAANRDPQRKKENCSNAGKIGGVIGGGHNKHDETEIAERLSQIEHIDLNKYGWVAKVAKVWNVSHAQVRRYIDKYYVGDVYKR